MKTRHLGSIALASLLALACVSASASLQLTAHVTDLNSTGIDVTGGNLLIGLTQPGLGFGSWPLPIGGSGDSSGMPDSIGLGEASFIESPTFPLTQDVIVDKPVALDVGIAAPTSVPEPGTAALAVAALLALGAFERRRRAVRVAPDR